MNGFCPHPVWITVMDTSSMTIKRCGECGEEMSCPHPIWTKVLDTPTLKVKKCGNCGKEMSAIKEGKHWLCAENPTFGLEIEKEETNK